MKISETVKVNAPKERVFEVFSDFKNAQDRLSGMTKLEVLKDKEGVGFRWRETRKMMGKEASEEMEITEYSKPNSYVVEAESRGVHYISRYYFDGEDEGTSVTWEFEGRPLSLMNKIFGPLFFLMFKGMTKKAMAQDVNDLKNFIEKG